MYFCFYKLFKQTFELSEETLEFRSDVQLGRVEDDEDEVGTVDEPLGDFVERVAALLLLAILNDPRSVDERNLL